MGGIQAPHLAQHVIRLCGHTRVEIDRFLERFLFANRFHQPIDTLDALGGFLVGNLGLPDNHGIGSRQIGYGSTLRVPGVVQLGEFFRGEPRTGHGLAHGICGAALTHGDVAIEQIVQQAVKIPERQTVHETR